MVVPTHSKKAKEVTRTTMELILRLRMDGYILSTGFMSIKAMSLLATSWIGLDDEAS